VYVDLEADLDELVFFVVMVSYGFTAYRGAAMARGFVKGLYRSRAYWVVALSLAILINDATGHLPYIGNYLLANIPLDFVSIPLLILVVYTFADRTILVALDLDFFHRNTLHWRQFRLVAYPLLYGEVALVFLENNGFPQLDPLATGTTFLVLFVLIFGYTLITVIFSARRTSDTVFKRHMLLLGLAFAIGIIALTNGFILSSDILDDLTALVGAYVWYRAAMTLTIVSKVPEK
jgi:hypothetical protein